MITIHMHSIHVSFEVINWNRVTPYDINIDRSSDTNKCLEMWVPSFELCVLYFLCQSPILDIEVNKNAGQTIRTSSYNNNNNNNNNGNTKHNRRNKRKNNNELEQQHVRKPWSVAKDSCNNVLLTYLYFYPNLPLAIYNTKKW